MHVRVEEEVVVEVFGCLVEVSMENVAGFWCVEDCVDEACCLVADGYFLVGFVLLEVY